MIEIFFRSILIEEFLLVDYAADQCEFADADNVSQFIDEPMLLLTVCEFEATFFLSNVMLMQNDQIMTEMIEFELVKRRDDSFAVVPLLKNTKCKNEDRVVSIQSL